jgi:hypothetical protein
MNGMKTRDLLAQNALGEDSTLQFNVDVKNADSSASKILICQAADDKIKIDFRLRDELSSLVPDGGGVVKDKVGYLVDKVDRVDRMDKVLKRPLRLQSPFYPFRRRASWLI